MGVMINGLGQAMVDSMGRLLIGNPGDPCCCGGGCCPTSTNFQITASGIGFLSGCQGRGPTTSYPGMGSYSVSINSFIGAAVNNTRCLTWGVPSSGGQAGDASAARWRWVDPSPFDFSVVFFDDTSCATELCTTAGLIWNIGCSGGNYWISAGTTDFNSGTCQNTQGDIVHPCVGSPGFIMPCQKFVPGQEMCFYAEFTLDSCSATTTVSVPTSRPTPNFIGDGAGTVTIVAGGC